MSKRIEQIKKLIDTDKVYTPEKAIELVKKTSNVKFDASVEVHVKLGIDTGRGDQQVRGTATLPYGTGKKKKIAVFVQGGSNEEKEAKEAGVQVVGGEELISEIGQTGKCDFDIAIATPQIMPKLARIAKILGPKGLMPNPKAETITTNIKKAVEDLQKGKISFKNDDSGNLHQVIGKVSFENKKILENFNIFIEAVRKAKPTGVKGIYIRNVSLCSSMGPSVKVGI
ncbi:MAG: 50S ribosomal protein L1 [Parcubacteria group bacterium CG23_combo_of_CG06-09_8_20_14_all_35_9]|nr:MAG: 50S ribosomal protein L1 [Parcubacteria group bacterium CG23_combo_of_CG06-09_8_20_14_all_35_9]